MAATCGRRSASRADDESAGAVIGDGTSGVLVLGVTAGSPAARAGLRARSMTADGRVRLGDVIEAVDGRPVENFADARQRARPARVRRPRHADGRRGEQRIEVPITLAAAGDEIWSQASYQELGVHLQSRRRQRLGGALRGRRGQPSSSSRPRRRPRCYSRMFAREFDRATMVCRIENIFQDGDWAILEWR